MKTETLPLVTGSSSDNLVGTKSRSLIGVLLLSAAASASAQAPSAAVIDAYGIACTASPCALDGNQSIQTGSGTIPASFSGGAETYSASAINYLLNTSGQGGTTSTIATSTNGVIPFGVGGNHSSVVVNGSTAPSLSVSMSSPGGIGGFGASGQTLASFTYYFEVVAPKGYTGPADVSVSLDAVGAASTASGMATSQSANANAQLVINTGLSSIDDLVETGFVISNGSSSSNAHTQGNGAYINPGFTISAAGSSMSGGFVDTSTFMAVIGQANKVTLSTNENWRRIASVGS